MILHFNNTIDYLPYWFFVYEGEKIMRKYFRLFIFDSIFFLCLQFSTNSVLQIVIGKKAAS